jgi:hypothetical protein
MTWLVREKVLPQLLVGERPSNREVLLAQTRLPPVGWRISMDNRRLGWALTEAALLPDGMTEIHGCVHFDNFPLEKMMPGWIQPLFHLLGKPADVLPMNALDAWSTLAVDGLGHLIRLDSTVRLEPLGGTISVRGTVDDGRLELSLYGGGKSFNHDIPMPSEALLSDLLSPQSQLPGLRDRQCWSVPVYNPLSASKNPVEIIFATVEGIDPKLWGGTPVDAWRVVYRGDPGSGPAADQNVRGIVWVRPNGTVIQQQVPLSGSVIDFVRLTKEETVELVKTAGRQWWAAHTSPQVKNK